MSAAHGWQQQVRSSTDESNTVAPFVALLRLAETVRAGLENSLDGIGLSWARYEILEVLSERGAMTYGDLGRSLLRHRTSIGATVCALEISGLVVRECNPTKHQQYKVSIDHAR